jgi:hypothetical protein
MSHLAFVDVQRFGEHAVHAIFAAEPASHDSTNALIFKREQGCVTIGEEVEDI